MMMMMMMVRSMHVDMLELPMSLATRSIKAWGKGATRESMTTKVTKTFAKKW